MQFDARLSVAFRACQRATIIVSATLTLGASPAWSQAAAKAPQSGVAAAPEKRKEAPAPAPTKPTPPRRPATPPSGGPVAPPPLSKAPPPPPLAPAPTVDASQPPPSLPRASREKMRVCAEEWDKMKKETATGLPMWREFATHCLTR